MANGSKLVGGGLRLFSALVYSLAFCAAAIILGIFSYFLAKLHYHNLGISKDWQAVEGMAGVAVIYLAFAMTLTLCLGGKTFFALLGLLMDLLICGAFIAIAILDRSGSTQRSGFVRNPLGAGQSNTTGVAGTNLGLASRLNTTSFACAIAGAGLMAIAFLMQLAMWRHHKKEKAFGPSPDNDYTSGSKKGGLFARKKRNDVEQPTYIEKETPVPVIPAHTTRDAIRPSHDTQSTYVQTDNNPSKYDNVPLPTTTGPNIVSTTHYTTPARYDPNYVPANANGTY
jgi:hypothetical protein